VLGPRPPLEHLVLSLDVIVTGPWAGSRHAIDPHGLCLSFGNARLPTALGPLGDEPDDTDETDETEVAPVAEVKEAVGATTAGSSSVSIVKPPSTAVPVAAWRAEPAKSQKRDIRSGLMIDRR
jgi:hypothetical protein